MALNIIPLGVRRAVAPELNLREASDRVYNAFDGGTSVQTQEFPSNNVSQSTIPIKSDPPNSSTIIDPQIYLRNQYEVTMNLTALGVAPALSLLNGVVTQLSPVPLASNADAPRSWCNACVQTSVDCKINGQSFTTDPFEYIAEMQRLSNFNYDQDNEYSTFPSMPDQFQVYGDGNGAARNPLGAYRANSTQVSRGGFLLDQVSVNTNTQAVFRFTVEEPVICSPWFYNRCGLVGIKTLNWVFNYSNMGRVWSHNDNPAAGGRALSSPITANILASTLVVKWYYPKLLDKIPRNVIYSYSEFLHLSISEMTPLANGSSDTLTISTQNLSAIPARIVIVVREFNDDRNATSSDSFAKINNVQVNWNGDKPTQFSQMSPYELYLMSRKNGLALSYPQFNYYTGSVVSFAPARDVGLKELESQGLLATPLFGCKVNFTNVSGVAKRYSLYAHVIYEGCMTIIDGVVTKSISVLTSQDVKNSMDQRGEMVVYDESERNWAGCGFWSDLWNGIKKGAESVYEFGKKAVPIVKEVLPYAMAAKKLITGSELEDLCEPDDGTNARPNYRGYRSAMAQLPKGTRQGKKTPGYEGGVPVGGVPVGGRKMSRAELKRQMELMMNQ